MDTKFIALQKIDGIYDIHPMMPPAMSILEITVLFILLVIFVTVSAYLAWVFVFSIKAKSKREIVNLRNKYEGNIISPHDAIYELCEILRAGINIKQLCADTPLPKGSKGSEKRWDKFIENLSDYRYNNYSDSSIDISPLFQESLYWIKS